MESRDEIVRLIRRCENMEYDATKLAEALRVQALANENGDPWCRISACYFVAWSYLMTDDSAKALPVCAEFFQLTEQYPENSLHPHFVLSLAAQAALIVLDMPQIPREQCKALLDQFESFSKQYNMGKRLFLEASCRYHLTMGLQEEAQRIFERLRTVPPDATRTCEACTVGIEAYLLHCLGRWKETRRVAEPLLNGTLTCQHDCQPGSILISLLIDDLENGDMEAASARVKRLSRMGFSDCSDLDAIGAIFLYHAATGPERSLRLLENGIAWSIGVWDMAALFDFYRGAWAICASLAKMHAELDLKLPKKFPIYRADGQYQTQMLADWFHDKTVEIGQKFDRRNGTNQYIQSLDIVKKGACYHEG